MRTKNKYIILKNNIIKLVSEKGMDDVDINLIDELVFNYQMVDKVKADLLSGSYMQNVRKNSDDDTDILFQVTPQMSIYNTCMKNIITISTKLSITPQERNKLGISKSNTDDGF
jgi:P27 family predicted phage terminase small subunit